MVFAFFSERVNNNNLFTPNGQRRKEKKLWANIAQSVILIVIYLKDRSYNLALVSQVLYDTLRRNHLGISYQSFPHSLHRHSKTLLNSKIRDTVWVAQESSSRYARRTNAKQKRGFIAKLYNTWRAWYASFRTLRRRVGKCSHWARKEKPKVFILFWCSCESRCL